MIPDILTILTNHGQSTTEQLYRAIPKKTGRTARSVRFEVKDNGETATLQIKGAPYLMVVQTGRKPTPQYDKPSRDFVTRIKEWLAAQGKDQGPAYAIARSIHKKGTALWRAGGNTIISDIVNESLTEKISRDILQAFAKYYLVSTVNFWNGNSNKSSAGA